MTEKKCKDCEYCIQDDGTPYCVMKDLYTHVDIEAECDEEKITGEKYFCKKKQKKVLTRYTD